MGWALKRNKDTDIQEDLEAIRQWLDIKINIGQFGVDTTGLLDMTDALNRIATRHAGKTLRVPPGAYAIYGTCDLSGVWLEVDEGARFVGTGNLSLRSPSSGGQRIFGTSLNVTFTTSDVIQAYWWAKPNDTTTDSSLGIQAAIDAAERTYDALVSGTWNVLEEHSGITLNLGGRYKVAGLTLNRPINIVGDGYNETYLITTSNNHILNIERKVDVAMVRSRIEEIGFFGSYTYRTDPAAISNQHGIKLTRDVAITGNALVEITKCQFMGLGGSGIYSDMPYNTPNSSGDKYIITENFIHLCGGYGIRFNGRHASSRIRSNHLTKNAGGIGLFGESDKAITTPFIEHNTIEANDGGISGVGSRIGSATKPGVGIYMRHTYYGHITRNYFEWHLNSIYVETQCQDIYVTENWFDGNDVNLPELHFDATGSYIDRQLSPFYAVGANNIHIVFERNNVYIPVKPGTTAALEWDPDTSGWGDTYETLPVLTNVSQLELIRNAARQAGGRPKDMTYLASAEDNLYFESIEYQTVGGLPVELHTYARREERRGFEENLKFSYHEFEGPSTTQSGYLRFIHPEALAATHKFTLTTAQRATADGALGADITWGWLDSGFLVLASEGLKALGQDFKENKIFFKDAPPTSGTFSFGDKVFNTKHVFGHPLGWTCVASGTPGTWASMETVAGAVAKTADYPVTQANNGTRFSNEGAIGIVVFSLPTTVAGTRFSFMRIATQIIRVDPSGTQSIRGGGGGKYLQLDADGDNVTLECFVTGGGWEITGGRGTYSYEA